MNRIDAHGTVDRIAGPVISASGLDEARLYDVVRVGEAGLVGEVIRLSRKGATIQVYEDTSVLRLGEPVTGTRQGLTALLGPGLLRSIYDGLQRPLPVLRQSTGVFIGRGVSASALPEELDWEFEPLARVGDAVHPGDVLGNVAETEHINHRIMVPPDCRGRVAWIAQGSRRIADTVDYAKVVARIGETLAGRHFTLIEKLAEEIAAMILRDFDTPWVRVSIAKLAPLRGVRKLGVVIERGKRP